MREGTDDAGSRPPDAVDAVVFGRWCAAALVAVRRRRRRIDELNVYPVPDGDTGTNMTATLAAGAESLGEKTDADLAGALRRFARGALLGARGNSGVILAQFFRGLAEEWIPAGPRVTAAGAAAGLRLAADSCRAAVAEPAEGTMLSVADAAADAASSVTRSGPDALSGVVRAAAAAAAEAVSRTPAQLPALARAGVVDAGGYGLALVLGALAAAVTGETPDEPGTAAGAGGAAGRADPDRETGSAAFAYEVQYLLDAPEESVDRLRPRLAALGDSLVVVGTGLGGDTPTWNVHVHVNDVGAAIEAGIEAGRPHRLSVARFADAAGPPAAPAGAAAVNRAVVVAADGDGLAALFAAEGAHPVAGTPSVGELLTAIRAGGAAEVIVLPCGDAAAAADRAAELARAEGVAVAVVPVRSAVQALAALAVGAPERRFDDDVIAMAEAAGACRYGEIIVAARRALTTAGPCAPGDVLGLADGDVVLIAENVDAAAAALLDRMCAAGGELVTLVTGGDLGEASRTALLDHLARTWPLVEVSCYDGGQRSRPLLIGVE